MNEKKDAIDRIIKVNEIKKTLKESNINNINNKFFISKKFFIHNEYKEKENNSIQLLGKKTSIFKVEDLSKYIIKNSSDNNSSNEGRWSKEEHNKFLEGLVIYGTNWKNFKGLIESRTSVQIRSHAQKFFQKMKLCKNENLGIDFTLDSICNFKDMIEQIKSNNKNYNIVNVFKNLNHIYSFRKSRKKKFSKNFKNNNNEIDLEINKENENNIINLKENNFINDNLNFNLFSYKNNERNTNVNSDYSVEEKIENFNQFSRMKDNVPSNNHKNTFNSINDNNFNIKNPLSYDYYSNLGNNLFSNNFLNFNYIHNNLLLNNLLRTNTNIHYTNGIILSNDILLLLMKNFNNNNILTVNNDINQINFLNNINNNPIINSINNLCIFNNNINNSNLNNNNILNTHQQLINNNQIENNNQISLKDFNKKNDF